ncbi:ATP-binding protein [Flavobacterium sp.]|uniref:tetratricopeptide repeat-containing sensor histidine kinase n=1 Tax=Flavobacterium sp. TaxID=239 RepID=UPI002B4AD3B3|nr:ATP-binding protein [Flavobacterium sp.]HLP65499.1 hypothetical protein [Flavobacterium sp.]
MIPKRNHFPILFLLVFFFSCQLEKKDPENVIYNNLTAKGRESYNKEDYKNALTYFFKALEKCDENDIEKRIYALTMIADIQCINADYVGAEETITKALSIKENSIYRSSLYDLLALVYEELNNYEKALKYYRLNLSNDKNLYSILMTKNNIAVALMGAKDYKKSTQILETLLKNDTISKHPKEYAKIMDNLGYCYFKQNDKKAIGYLNQSIRIRDSLDDNHELTASLMHLSEYYFDKQPQLSHQYAFKAYQSATKVNNPDDRLEALDFLIKNASGNNLKEYYRIHSTLNDSIIKVRQSAKNQYAYLRFNSDKAVQALEIQKTKSYLYLVLLLLFSGAASFIIVTIRKRNREKIKTISYETETRIAKKIHDELANDVFNALTFAESQNLSDPNKKEALLDNLDTIYNRTRNISRENSEIKTDSQFAQQLTDLLKQYESDTVRVIIQEFSTINWDDMKKEAKIAIYRVLQELMVNMKKHSECTFVILKFNNQKSHIEINYSDNGKGVKMLNSKKGLQNAENRIHAIKGTITFDFETDKGFRASIKIPK